MIIKKIYQHAILQPSKVAVTFGTKTLTYEQLYKCITYVANLLQKSGIKEGHIIAICYPHDKLMDLLVTLSLNKIGAISCSIGAYQIPKTSFLPSCVISDKSFNSDRLIRQLLINRDIIDDLPNNKNISFHNQHNPDRISRLILTSGTTGTSKAVPLTNNQIIKRVTDGALTLSIFHNEFSLFGLSTAGGFNAALRSLLLGNPFFSDARDLINLLKNDEIGIISGSPVQIEALAPYIKKYQKHNLAAIMLGGSPLPVQLKKIITEELNLTLLDYYGSTEVGGVYFRVYSTKLNKPHSIPVDNISIEAVSESRHPLPINSEGVIRIKSNSMSDHYFEDANSSIKHFIDGWFYPGDIGSIDISGNVTLHGRLTEIINIGGVKIAPNIIDEFLMTQESVDDCGTFGLEDSAGIERIAVAIVNSNKINLKKIKSNFKIKFGDSLVPTYFFRVSEIPRNKMGKISRTTLKSKLKHLIKKL